MWHTVVVKTVAAQGFGQSGAIVVTTSKHGEPTIFHKSQHTGRIASSMGGRETFNTEHEPPVEPPLIKDNNTTSSMSTVFESLNF